MGLTETYSRILEEINRKDPYQRSLAIACFRWILSATRELRWVELELVLPLAGPNPAESYQDCLDGPSINFVSSACGNLVHIPKKEITWWGDEKVTFIHSSLFQFFSENFATLVHTGDPWKVLSDTEAMHRQNALECMSYLCLLIDEGLDSSKNLERQLDADAFAYYSINNFDRHLIASNEASHPPSTALDLAQQLLDRDESFLETLLCMRLMLHSDVAYGIVSQSPYPFIGPAVPEYVLWTTQLHKIMSKGVSRQSPGTTLRLLAKSGLLGATENFIRQGFFQGGRNNIDEEDEYGRSALYLASYHGHPLLVELLIREGAKPEPCAVRENSRVLFEGSTPLCAAISERKYGVVEVLLKAGVNVNIPVRLFGALYSPLKLAELQGDDEIVRLLEEGGADRRGSEAGKVLTPTGTDDTVGGAESG
jgi:hypothetical protein